MQVLQKADGIRGKNMIPCPEYGATAGLFPGRKLYPEGYLHRGINLFRCIKRQSFNLSVYFLIF